MALASPDECQDDRPAVARGNTEAMAGKPPADGAGTTEATAGKPAADAAGATEAFAAKPENGAPGTTRTVADNSVAVDAVGAGGMANTAATAISTASTAPRAESPATAGDTSPKRSAGRKDNASPAATRSRATTVADSTLGKALRAEMQYDGPGAMLRRAREARGLSIGDIARITKVGSSTLAALETNDVLRLPAAVFTRGFIKAYAAEVGLDPDSTAEEYLARIEPMASHHLLVDDGQLPPVNDDADAVIPVNDDMRHLLAEQQARRFGRLATIAAVLGFVVYVWSFTWTRAQENSNAIVNAPASSDAAHAGGGRSPGDAAPAVAQSSAPAIGAPSGPLRLELQPQGPCWLTANVDGTPVVAKLLQAGERHTLEATEELVLRVGDPGALSFSINGQAGRPLGRAGEPVNVRITKDNFRDFLSL